MRLQKRLQNVIKSLKPIIGIEAAVISGLVFCIVLALQNMPVRASNDFNEASPAIVVITANWCAKCRDMPEITSNVLERMNKPDYRIVTLDVDNPSTPSLAKRYGINMQGNAVPQIYLFSQGQTRLLLDANSYELGAVDEATQSIEQQLQGQ